jgi:hypothetical protein
MKDNPACLYIIEEESEVERGQLSLKTNSVFEDD